MTDASADDRGSVLLLVPAGILVLLVLGAIAVDHAVVALGQRELAAAVAAAANDAATAAIDDAAFYEGGDIVIDAVRAETVARAALAARSSEALEDVTFEVAVAGRQVCVHATAAVRHVFATAVPGARATTTVRARSTATAAAEDEPVPERVLC